jgi:GNAT superfamily N-acetyltransferase
MIIHVTTDDEIINTYDTMKELRPEFQDPGTYLKTVKRIRDDYGYKLAALKDENEISAVAGYRYGEALSWKKYLYVDDLVTQLQYRSKGYGKQLFQWLVDEARRNNCAALHLDSGVQRHDAHRFYLRERMDIVFYHFRYKVCE